MRALRAEIMSPGRRRPRHTGAALAAGAALAVALAVPFEARLGQGKPEPAEPVDHAAILRSLTPATLARGGEIYTSACAACHGADGTASLPTARSFGTDAFAYGGDPYSMWQTVTYGRGMMAAQSWLTPEERYYAIQYIRERIVGPRNPGAYVEMSDAYLRGLPRPDRAATAAEIARAARAGLQSAGQAWAQQQPGDYGPALYSQIGGAASSALTVSLDHDVYLSYDLLRMRLAAAWAGRLDLGETKFRRYRGEGKPVPEGDTLPGLDAWQWSYGETGSRVAEQTSPRTPLPPDLLAFKGHYAHGDRVILSYQVLGRDVLEMPAARRLDDALVVTHALRLGPSSRAASLRVARLDTPAGARRGVLRLDDLTVVPAPLQAPARQRVALLADGAGAVVAAGLTGDADGFRWEIGPDGALILHVPARRDAVSIQVHRFTGGGTGVLERVARFLREESARGADDRPDLDRLVRGGPRRWPETVTTGGRLDAVRAHFDPVHYRAKDRDAPGKLVDLPADYPYTVDEIALPFDNPWNAWVRPTDLEFFPDGRLVLATYTGDVWVASGVDAGLRSVAWQRIATGLYEPMGLEIVDGQIYVAARDRIVRLGDRNGDGETDFYESFYADRDVSDFFHAFAFGLQRDRQGRFYYAKSGQYTSNATPGNLVRVAPDGSRGETIATGFRTPNGVTVAPDGRVFVSDNQGNWTPANEINLVRPDRFYGYVPNIATRHWSPGGMRVEVPEGSHDVTLGTVTVPAGFTEPVLWLPQEFDNSPGGGTWSAPSWGPLGNRFIHTSFGKGWIYHVMLQDVGEVAQGAAVALPFQFDAGTQRASVNPADGQVYVAGLTGWDDGFATRYGHLSRVRYRGGAGRLLLDAKVRADGVALTFNFAVDAGAAADPGRYEALAWNYRWQRRYGSDDWSLVNPSRLGRDTVSIARVEISGDRREVLLRMPGIRPADQMRIRMDIRSGDGAPFRESVYLTIHAIPDR